MLKLLRTLKIEKSSAGKGDSGTNAAAASAATQTDPPPGTAGWHQFSSRLLGRLSSATQTPMTQMPGALPAPETPSRKK